MEGIVSLTGQLGGRIYNSSKFNYGSYAYSLKKCAASINFVDGNIPLLIGPEYNYKGFESGTREGHIYIGKGDSFKAEYDSNENITEYTSLEDMKLIHYLKPPLKRQWSIMCNL